MTAGAHDYLLKHNLARLLPAIERELREADQRRQRRRAEQARSHLAAVVESSDDAILSVTPEGILLSWNGGAESIFGYSGTEARGQNIEFLFAHPEKELIHKFLARIMGGERVNRIQTVCLRKDFRPIDVSLTVSAIKNSDGQVIGVSAIARDITERRRAEAEREKLLRELQQALSEVKTLSGLLPICASCKKIRDDGGYWHQVEVYVQQHSKAAFTHGFCPDCIRKLYPQYADEIMAVRAAKPK
jgi:PAS domain S-box-containing protein